MYVSHTQARTRTHRDGRRKITQIKNLQYFQEIICEVKFALTAKRTVYIRREMCNNFEELNGLAY